MWIQIKPGPFQNSFLNFILFVKYINKYKATQYLNTNIKHYTKEIQKKNQLTYLNLYPCFQCYMKNGFFHACSCLLLSVCVKTTQFNKDFNWEVKLQTNKINTVNSYPGVANKGVLCGFFKLESGLLIM